MNYSSPQSSITPAIQPHPGRHTEKNVYTDEYHSSRVMAKGKDHMHPGKALSDLLAFSQGWRLTHHGLKHEDAQLELATWNNWLTCDFTVDSVERFPLSIWERLRLAGQARKLCHRLIMKSLVPDCSAKTLQGALIESICFHPQDWEVCTDVIHHRSSGVELVTRDGPFLLRCSPMSRVHFGLGLFGRFSLWIGIKRLVRRAVAGRLQTVAAALQGRARMVTSS